MTKGKFRAASVGYTFGHPDIEEIAFNSSRTLLGLDLVLLRLAGLPYLYTYGLESERYRGKVSLGEGDSVRILEDVARRKREVEALLELGGTLVLFLPAPESWYIDTGNRQHSGTGRNRQTTIMVSAMSLASALPFALKTEAAETRELELRASDPFATFWRICSSRFETAAILKEPFGETTLVIDGTETIAGSIARVEKGLVVILPEGLLYPKEPEEDKEGEGDAPEEEEGAAHPWDVELIDALFELVRGLRSGTGDFEQPQWASDFLLPGEDEASGDVRMASGNVAEAQRLLDNAQRRLALLQQRKTLLTGTGPALEALVAEAFSALGFEVEEGRPGRTDRIARLGKKAAVIETKGLTKSAGEKDAAQLEKWVNEYFIEHGEQPKGILAVNGWRARPLDKRTEPVFPNQMLKYSKSREHCLISTTQLLGGWLDAEGNPKRRKEIASSLLSYVGRYADYEDWTQFVTHDQQSVEEVGPAGPAS